MKKLKLASKKGDDFFYLASENYSPYLRKELVLYGKGTNVIEYLIAVFFI